MLSASERKFRDLFARNRRFIIPFFQRSYVWKHENWERFLTDMEGIAENGENYFMGSLVFKPSDEAKTDHIEKRVIIDGQQRITTIILFLRAIAELNPDDDMKSVCNSIIFNLSNGSGKESIVEHNYNDVEIFDAIIEGKLRKSLEKRYRYSNVLGCYNYFLEREKIILDINPEDIIAGMYFISIELGDDDDEQQIFNTINTHGVSLTTAGLLKSYLFSKDDKDLYESTWKRTFEGEEEIRNFWNYEVRYGNKFRSNIDFFLQAYLVKQSDNKHRGLEKLFSAYKLYITEKKIKDNEKDKEVFIKNLNIASKIYHENFNPYILKESSFNNSPLDILNAVIFGLSLTQIIPYALYIMEVLGNNEVELNKTLSLLNSYLIRRLICRKTSKNYSAIFISFIKENIDSYKKLEDTIYGFKDFEYDIFPNDVDFKDSFLVSNLNNTHSKIILCILEKHLMDSTGRDSMRLHPMKTYTLEHIMPKSWEDNWFKELSDEDKHLRRKLIRSLANLTILTEPLNRGLGNKSWDVKREQMQEHCSGIRIIKDYLDSPDWNEETIKQRGEYLFGIAKDIWKY